MATRRVTISLPDPLAAKLRALPPNRRLCVSGVCAIALAAECERLESTDALVGTAIRRLIANSEIAPCGLPRMCTFTSAFGGR